MANHPKPDLSEEDIKQAEAFWNNFTEYSKYAIIAVCITLIILGIFLL